MNDGLEMDHIKTKFGWLLQLRRELRLMNKRDKMFVSEKERERKIRQTKTKGHVVREREREREELQKKKTDGQAKTET
jgi:hypothetical protein